MFRTIYQRAERLFNAKNNTISENDKAVKSADFDIKAENRQKELAKMELILLRFV